MFCPNCGKQVNSGASFCENCGCALNSYGTSVNNQANVQAQVNAKNTESKTGIGCLLGFFLGLIGLLIGFSMFQPETVARKTFTKGWLIAFGISAGISILYTILVFTGVIDVTQFVEYYY